MTTLVDAAYLPANRSEVTEAWLADTLAGHPLFDTDRIRTVALEYLGDGIGQLSTLLLADLVQESGTKHQLVIKLHTDVPSMHELGLRYGHYESEISFYKHLADQVPVRTPELYAVDMDREAERVLVIMESFADWHSPNQVDGATLEEVTIAVAELAGLTAAFWNAPIRKQFPWLRNLQSEAYATVPADYVASTDLALDHMGDLLPASSDKAAQRIGSRCGPLMTRLSEGNQALSHWDYRVENFFYGPEGEFVVIDWQLMMVTNPATDFAYLLGTNIDTELRRSAEADLMAGYLEGLRRHGVTGYSRSDLERDYRLALMGVSSIPIIGGAAADVTNERSIALFSTIGGRLFQAIEDWEALALLP